MTSVAIQTQTVRRPRLSYKDIQILFLSSGLGAVRAAFEAGEITKRGLTLAVDAFDGNKAAGVLEGWVSTLSNKRGRRPPTAEESRRYRVAKDNRITVSTAVLGAGPKDYVIVRFEKNAIEIRRSA